MPPSDNRLHRTGARSYIRYKSKEYQDFLHHVETFRLEHNKSLSQARHIIKSMFKPAIEFNLYFAASRLYTKKHTLKRLDTSNFIKAAQDAACSILGVDDNIFWQCTARRFISACSEAEYLDIIIKEVYEQESTTT